jgi:hypothetical protein
MFSFPIGQASIWYFSGPSITGVLPRMHSIIVPHPAGPWWECFEQMMPFKYTPLKRPPLRRLRDVIIQIDNEWKSRSHIYFGCPFNLRIWNIIVIPNKFKAGGKYITRHHVWMGMYPMLVRISLQSNMGRGDAIKDKMLIRARKHLLHYNCIRFQRHHDIVHAFFKVRGGNQILDVRAMGRPHVPRCMKVGEWTESSRAYVAGSRMHGISTGLGSQLASHVHLSESSIFRSVREGSLVVNVRY